MQHRLEESETRFRLLLDGAKDYSIVFLNPNGIIQSWHCGVELYAFRDFETLIGRPISRIYPTEDVSAGKPERDLAAALEHGRIEHEGWRIHADGSLYWAKLVTTALKEDNRLQGYSIVLKDVTERKRTEAALKSVVDHSTDALITIDRFGVIQSFAGAAQKIFGYTAAEVVGDKINRLMPEPWSHEHDGYMKNYLDSRHPKIIGIGREVVGLRKDGSTVSCDLTVTEFMLGEAHFFTGILRDITERKAAQEQLRLRATRDLLTGSWNRATILDLIGKELNRGHREEKPVGLIFVDFDHFKRINDTYGHLGGDAVLRASGERMRAIMRPYDLVGRYGGEEFVIALPGCDEDSLRKVCERLRICLAETPVEFENRSIPFTVSIGAAMSTPTKNVQIESLLRAADAALYQAKSGGRNRVELATN